MEPNLFKKYHFGDFFAAIDYFLDIIEKLKLCQANATRKISYKELRVITERLVKLINENSLS
jgi:hypothetical protein